MNKKLAIVFPGIGYSVERPLLYYSRKILQKKGYEVINIGYSDFEKDGVLESKERLLQFVTNANECVKQQLENVDFSMYDRIIFVSKSIGAVISAVYAKQMGILPYNIMITPIDYAFQFMGDESGCVLCGTADPLVNFKGVEQICKEKRLNFYDFQLANHSLETGNIDVDVDYLKRYVTILDETLSDMDKSIYDCEIVCRDQIQKSMSEYKGKVLLIVNTATGCGFTPQYKMLQHFYEKYNKQGFEILDFPCNQFDNQAPGSEADIYSFCTSRYDISFEQFAKVNVNGEKQADLYEFLKARKGFKGFDMSSLDSQFLAHKLEKSQPGYELSSDIKWNFTKFLVNRNGQVIERFEPTTDLQLVEMAIQQIL